MSSSGWNEQLIAQLTTDSAEATMAVAEVWAPLLLEKSNGAVLALAGPMGGGKTTFIKGLAAALGAAPSAAVSSPTYSYMHMYEGGDDHLYHFDLYRLRGGDDFMTMGFDDFLERGVVCCIEWPERIGDLLPEDHYLLTFEPLSVSERRLTLLRRSR